MNASRNPERAARKRGKSQLAGLRAAWGYTPQGQGGHFAGSLTDDPARTWRRAESLPGFWDSPGLNGGSGGAASAGWGQTDLFGQQRQAQTAAYNAAIQKQADNYGIQQRAREQARDRGFLPREEPGYADGLAPGEEEEVDEALATQAATDELAAKRASAIAGAQRSGLRSLLGGLGYSLADGYAPSQRDIEFRERMAAMDRKYGLGAAKPAAVAPTPAAKPAAPTPAAKPVTMPLPGNGMAQRAAQGEIAKHRQLQELMRYRDGLAPRGLARGIVRGPESELSRADPRRQAARVADSVPARLSVDEAVLPANTVDALGGPDSVASLIEATNGRAPQRGLRRAQGFDIGYAEEELYRRADASNVRKAAARQAAQQAAAAPKPPVGVPPGREVIVRPTPSPTPGINPQNTIRNISLEEARNSLSARNAAPTPAANVGVNAAKPTLRQAATRVGNAVSNAVLHPWDTTKAAGNAIGRGLGTAGRAAGRGLGVASRLAGAASAVAGAGGAGLELGFRMRDPGNAAANVNRRLYESAGESSPSLGTMAADWAQSIGKADTPERLSAQASLDRTSLWDVMKDTARRPVDFASESLDRVNPLGEKGLFETEADTRARYNTLDAAAARLPKTNPNALARVFAARDDKGAPSPSPADPTTLYSEYYSNADPTQHGVTEGTGVIRRADGRTTLLDTRNSPYTQLARNAELADMEYMRRNGIEPGSAQDPLRERTMEGLQRAVANVQMAGTDPARIAQGRTTASLLDARKQAGLRNQAEMVKQATARDRLAFEQARYDREQQAAAIKDLDAVGKEIGLDEKEATQFRNWLMTNHPRAAYGSNLPEGRQTLMKLLPQWREDSRFNANTVDGKTSAAAPQGLRKREKTMRDVSTRQGVALPLLGKFNPPYVFSAPDNGVSLAEIGVDNLRGWLNEDFDSIYEDPATGRRARAGDYAAPKDVDAANYRQQLINQEELDSVRRQRNG
ncbi:MAG: hypothetical protein LBU11_08380 [Zoogloeaceae bacterium]|nr:hypothetical protein [Zoogloeaceae bacterium]